MKLKCLYCLLGLMLPLALSAQTTLPQLPQPKNVAAYLASLASNPKITADSAMKILAGWSAYPALTKTGCNYVYDYQDSTIGKILLRVYVPANYQSNKKTPCILQLHGAVGHSKFSDIDSLTDSDEGILTDPLKANNYIIIQPLGDEKKGFTWGANKWKERGQGYEFNLIYKKLNKIVASLKQVLNIDDNRVYAFGHSDGSDGAIGLGVYQPDQFAGVVAYNTMFKNLFTHDYYIRNIQNRALYEVHSDKDQLRRIGPNRQFIDSIKKFDNRLTYREYIGYEHWDKHLSIDAPNAEKFMKGTARNPYQPIIYLETTQSSPYNTCDWLTITQPDTGRVSASWYRPYEIVYKEYIPSRKQWFTANQFEPLKSAVVKAAYKDNVFSLQTSAVDELEIKISPQMADLNKPVIVLLNGKQVFNGWVTSDKKYLVDNFGHNFDRQALWVNTVKVKVE